MNITKEIINDLIPLYAANECSADTRVLVEDYLRQHPQEALELRRIMNTPIPGRVPTAIRPDEMESLRRARRIVRRQSWLMAFAIFFSLVPFSFLHTGGRTYWLFLEAPVSALVYFTAGIGCWLAYAIVRSRFKAL